MLRIFLPLLLAVGVCVDVSLAQKVTTLGSLELAYAMALSNPLPEELALTDVESTRLQEHMTNWMKSRDRREFERLKRRAIAESTQEKHLRFLNQPVVEELNSRFLEDIDSVLASNKRSERFRQLFGQCLVRFGHFECLLRLNNLKPELKEYEAIHDQFVEMAKAVVKIEESKRLEFVVDSAERNGVLSKKEVEDLSGEKWGEIDYLERSGIDSTLGMAITRYFRSDLIDLLLLPKVQVELAMTPAQLQTVAEKAKSLKSKMTSKSVMVVLNQQGPKAFEKELETWMERIENVVSETLEPTQAKRLKQLFFQRVLAEGDMSWALKLAGKSPKDQVPQLNNDVSAYVFYSVEAEKLMRGREILADLYGRARTDRILGKLVLPTTTPWENESNKVTHARFRKMALKRMDIQNVSGENPRRR